MPGTASNFLKYNTDGVMMHILAIEDHLRYLDSKYRSEDSSCLVKHALQLREQSLEGISHSNEIGDKEKVQVFRDLVHGSEKLQDLFKQRTSPDDLILEVRKLRKRAEALDPSFNLEKCQSCGNMEDVGRMTRSLKAIDSVEDDMVSRTVNFLSEKYKVTPPKVEIIPGCHDPEKALYTDKTIRLCSGGASVHVIAHEFKHYAQDLEGKNLDEAEAERFAIDFLEKDLNVKSANYTVSENKMAVSSAKLKMIAVIYGSPYLAYGASQGLNMANARYPRAKLIGDAILTGVGLYAIWKWYGTKNEPIATVLGIMGGVASTDLVFNQLPLLLAPVTSARLRMASNNNVTTPPKAAIPQNTVMPIIKSGNLGKYAVNMR